MSKTHELSGLVKWSYREEWKDLFDEVFDEHFGLAFEDYGIDFEALEKLIGETDVNNLWGCAFEDFLTRSHPDDEERNIVDDYLKRRGWKETVTTRRYIEALRDSLFSLYEVSGIVPGQSMLVRDLLRGGEPLKVTDHTATRILKAGDHLGCRVVEVAGRHRLAGGLIRFSDAAATIVIKSIGGALAMVGDEATKQGIAPDDELDGIDLQELGQAFVLHGSAPDFTEIWLEDKLSGRLPKIPPPRFNSDGDELEFHSVSYPLTPGASVDAIARRLDGIPDLRADKEDGVWNWVDAQEEIADAPSLPLSEVRDGRLHVELEDGTPVLASVELFEDGLVLTANSKLRADRGKVMLKSALKGMLGQPTTQIHEHRGSGGSDEDSEPGGSNSAS